MDNWKYFISAHYLFTHHCVEPFLWSFQLFTLSSTSTTPFTEGYCYFDPNLPETLLHYFSIVLSSAMYLLTFLSHLLTHDGEHFGLGVSKIQKKLNLTVMDCHLPPEKQLSLSPPLHFRVPCSQLRC